MAIAIVGEKIKYWKIIVRSREALKSRDYVLIFSYSSELTGPSLTFVPETHWAPFTDMD